MDISKSYIDHIPEDATWSIEKIVLTQGFKIETHYVTTSDGFINLIHRIYRDSHQGKPVIMMQHGLIDSSDVFVLNDRDKAPEFVAADAGYDIWMPNHRGNKYSRDHLRLDSNVDAQYWHHSFPEFAKFDMPAFFKYIKNKTGVDKLTYVGHSQGTIEMFYAMGLLIYLSKH